MRRAPPPGVLCLMGPTAVGKTTLALALVERLPLEIVSVDSAMVYRGMDIGSGKPDASTLSRVRHHLVDIRAPHETYSAAQFVDDAREAVASIHARGRWPLLVGGTGLYFRAFARGLSPLPSADPALRASLAAEARALGWPELHRRLARVDAAAASRIRPTDQQRIQRALEVHAITGRPLSALQRDALGEASPWPVHAAQLLPADRGWLHERIERRFRGMVASGLVEEVQRLALEPRVHRELPAMRAVGYRQVLDCLLDHGDATRMEHEAIVATRQLARRQLTWLRREAAQLQLAGDAQDPVAALSAWACRSLGL